jgi:acetyltransferase-like isoleucine patch superfamily enzyme
MTLLQRLAGEGIRRVWEKAGRLGAIRSGDRRAQRFYAFGKRSAICFPQAALVGDDRIAIGSGTVVGPYSTVSAGLAGQPRNPEWAGPTLVIGDRCVIGRNATITAHREIRIGDDVWTGNDVFISDQNHAWDDPSLPIGAQAQEPRPVVIGDGAWIGHGAIVLPGVVIGRRAVIAAGAVVTVSVPDFSVVGGVPARLIGPARDDVTPITRDASA